MAGPMGGQIRTHRHQYVMRIDPRHGLIFLRGAVPGNRNCYVKIEDSLYRAPNRCPFPTFFPEPEESGKFHIFQVNFEQTLKTSCIFTFIQI